jgi:hypothetical protein
MRPIRRLSAKNLLDTWEMCLDEPAPLRGARLLASACDDTSGDTAKWPIACRDAGLFDLREQLFGPVVDAVVLCSKCGERAEVQFAIDQIREPSAGTLKHSGVIQVDGRRVRYRAPTSEDLLAIAGCDDVDAARMRLLERCLGTTELTDELVRRAIERISRDQAQADVQVNFDCPSCGNAWEAPFDIASFLWREVDDWARRLLREIHVIASTYGWSEVDILSMSARRRQAYLEVLGE